MNHVGLKPYRYFAALWSPFGMCVQVLLTLSLGLGSIAWGQGPRCQELFQASRIFELAKLRQAINEATHGGQGSVLRSRLTEDFDQKLQQLLRNNPQNREQILNELREALRTLGPRASTDATEAKKLREVQKLKLKAPSVKLKTYLRTQIDAATLRVQDGAQARLPPTFKKPDTGVFWSADERYVAFRPENLSNPGINQPTLIYDLQTRLQIAASPTHGFFAEQGHLWFTDADNQVRVTDIVSGKILGEFSGTTRLEPGMVTDKYVIVFDEGTKLMKYFSGEVHRIGHHYGICQRCDTLAYVEHGRIRLIRLSTGQDLGIDLGVTGAEQTHPQKFSEGLLTFAVNGENKLMLLDDLVVRVAPANSYYHESVPGTRWTFFSTAINGVVTRIFTNHDTGAVRRIVGDLMSRKASKMIVKLDHSNRWVKLDLDNGTQREIPGEFDELEMDHYLVKLDETSKGLVYTFHDLKKGQTFDFHFNGVVVAVPGTNVFRFTDEGGNHSWLSTLDNFEDRTATLNHAPYVRPGISPKGTYFIAEDQGKIVIVTQDRGAP